MYKEVSNIYLFLLKILCNYEIYENSSYFSVTREEAVKNVYTFEL
jgi:hypothetical protein